MGPTLLDSSKEECHKILRRMELETYGAVVSTLRAQGELNKDRRKLLEDLSVIMKISPERHKAEIRRAVNDEKLGCIAERLSGRADTEWAWALEGRRVVPLMPRLVRPTLFTSLATSVSKAVAQNPQICLNQTPINKAGDDASSKYVRDPDDEDTLSPVMVPIASPDSSCHSNNNFEPDFMDTPAEKNFQFTSIMAEDEKKSELFSKKTVPVLPNSVKRPRSPSNQVVNFSTPLSKVRAVSPSCVRPQHKLITTPHQPSPQLMPRGQVNTPVRPPPQHLPSSSTVPANTGKIRVRTPVVQSCVPRPSPIGIRPSVSPYAQVQPNQPRPIASSVKQVVQIRASSLSQQQQQAIGQSKEATIPRTVQTSTPVTVQAVTTMASSIGKQLPGKANVIVLHKNLPMAKTITTVGAREVDRSGSLGKSNFLPKPIITPSGTKVTFPSNVRIISVPSGNVVGAGGGSTTGVPSSVNHTALTQKIVQTAAAGAAAQKNVYVLELSNDAVGKSIILGDIMPASLNSEVNGTTSKNVTPNLTNIKDSFSVKTEQEIKTETINSDAKDNELLASRITTQSLEFDLSARENSVKNGEFDVHSLSHFEEISEVIIDTPKSEPGILDPHTGLLYNTNEEQIISQPIAEQSSVDIFSTAIASADINMEATAYCSDDNAGSTRLILTDNYDSPSAKS